MQWNHQSITGRRKKRLRHFSDNFQRWIETKSNQHMALYSLNVLIGKYLVDLGTLSPVSKVSLTREWPSERYFQHSKIKFVSPRGHVISSFILLTEHVWLRWICTNMSPPSGFFARVTFFLTCTEIPWHGNTCHTVHTLIMWGDPKSRCSFRILN